MKTIMQAGGLGNQMFQYAFYLSCRARGIRCRVDISLYRAVRMHNGYEMDRIFRLDEPVRRPGRLTVLLNRILYRFRPSALVWQVPNNYQFAEEAYTTRASYLVGCWVNEGYFASIGDRIRKQYVFQNIKPENMELAARMQGENSVSVHIRRGDYLSLPDWCVCTEKYYAEAIRYICGQTEHPVFYVFSNDPAWCHGFMRQFGVDYAVVENNQGADSYQDMYLMTQCRHNIIANSTFSWWGAWLNANTGKIVVAPKYWFSNSLDNANCEGWHLIDNL